MNDHGRPTPHRIGNDGEAPVDTNDWDQLPMFRKLRALADSLDAAIHTNAPRTEYSVDPAEVDRVIDCLREIADEEFDRWKRTGWAQ